MTSELLMNFSLLEQNIFLWKRREEVHPKICVKGVVVVEDMSHFEVLNLIGQCSQLFQNFLL